MVKRERRQQLVRAVKAVRTCVSTNDHDRLDEVLEFAGHPGGCAVRATRQNNPTNSSASTTEKNTVSS